MLFSLVELLSLLLLFSVAGLAISPDKLIKKDFILTPSIGFAAIIGIAYSISGIFKFTGSDSTALALALLGVIFLFRIKAIAQAFYINWQQHELKTIVILCLIPSLTLLAPALILGFKQFYGYVNFDFFYNSQDSWFLSTHHIAQYQQTKQANILPLDWSASHQGRFAVSLLGSFFYKWFHLDTLAFNSLLLNSLVVIFALNIAKLSQTLFKFKNHQIYVAVFLTILCGPYVQAYNSYLLGQISAVPIFVLYLLYLKRFLANPQLQDRDNNVFFNLNSNIIALALIFNILYILYAILGMFAIAASAVCLLFIPPRESMKLLKICLLVALFSLVIFFITRITNIPETITTLSQWISTSAKVASHKTLLMPEYLIEPFFSIFFGLSTYPVENSILFSIIHNSLLQNSFYMVMGIGVTFLYIFLLYLYAKDKQQDRASKAVILSLSSITLILAGYFFITYTAYGIFKLSTWFIPILFPLFVYGLFRQYRYTVTRVLSISLCSLVILFNLITSATYISGYFNKKFDNIGYSHHLNELSSLSKQLPSQSSVAIFLRHGTELAWVSNQLRHVNIDYAAHNTQILQDKLLLTPTCANLNTYSKQISQANLWIVNTALLKHELLRTPPSADAIVYQGKHYSIVNPKRVKTFIFFGSGSYPTSTIPTEQAHALNFMSRFRWVEKGLEIMIYSNKARTSTLNVKLRPGFVNTDAQTRKFTLSFKGKSYHYTAKKNQIANITVPKLNFTPGLNCVLITSPDIIGQPNRWGALLRKHIPHDARKLNFAVGEVKLSQ